MHKNILVIDDNPDIRFLICNILKEQNFNVRSAANYDQAVLEINKKLPDLAIVDIKLDKADKDGIDLLKLIIRKNKLTPVIMISGHATVQIAVEAIRLGLPILTSKRMSRLNQFVENGVNGLIVDDKDLLDSTIYLLKNPDLLRKMSYESYKKYQVLCMQAPQDKWADILKSKP